MTNFSAEFIGGVRAHLIAKREAAQEVFNVAAPLDCATAKLYLPALVAMDAAIAALDGATPRTPVQVTGWRPPHLGREIADATLALVLCNDGTLWSGDGANWWLLPQIPQAPVK